MDDGVCKVLQNGDLIEIIVCGLNGLWFEWVSGSHLFLFMHVFEWSKMKYCQSGLLFFRNTIKWKNNMFNNHCHYNQLQINITLLSKLNPGLS